ncbi:MAG: hypothetical protein JAZ17_18630 [Candidatus Thiodiazotropha endolucinida]|nr:hypothetical protein [Candidatus Thiodiazotropha taylori]MCG8047312.1 hypothetical protein [Candidatus Thiodiazotropha taylori]MCG8095603.1 hypothetical protein [Candidatus Thiodiazotropha endolucinida]MCW4263125.1 hypothetical protein [Candidatus Thiodiazotropha endolucinida]
MVLFQLGVAVRRCAFLFDCTPIARGSDWVRWWLGRITIILYFVGAGAFVSVACSNGIQLLVLFCSSFSVALFSAADVSALLFFVEFPSLCHLGFVISFFAD